MQIVKVKAWNIRDQVVDISTLNAEPHSVDLLKKSILKSGYRAHSLTDRSTIEKSSWYRKYLIGEKTYFYIEGSGAYVLSNIDVVDNEFYFEKVNLPIGHKPWIFYSWQSDYNTSRSNIKDALVELIDHVNQYRSPKEPLELVEATRPENGAEDIVDAIRENIDKSLVCIFDITNTVRVSDTKSYPNPNVSFELGYSLQRKSNEQVFIAKRERNDSFPGADNPPFDYEHNRFIRFSTPAVAKSSLKLAVLAYLERIDFITKLKAAR